MSKVNPKVRKVEIGVRTLREITIWPLSLADEIAFGEKIVSLVDQYEEVNDPSVPTIPDDISTEALEDILTADPKNKEAEIAKFIISAIKDNLIDLLGYVTDEEVTLADLDNEQFMDIADLIFEINYDGAVGKAKRLLMKVQSLFGQKTQSPNSASQPVTDMNTSSDSVTGKEE